MVYTSKLAALQDKRGFALTDPEVRWTIPNDLLEKQARAVHNEYLTMDQATVRIAEEKEAAKAAAKRAGQRAMVATLDAQVAAKEAARRERVVAMAREQSEMDASLVALQHTLLREQEARVLKREVFNAAQRDLVELTKARKRAEREADAEYNRERLAKVLEANAADAERLKAKTAANRALLRQTQVENVQRKREQVEALVTAQKADVELARLNEVLLEQRAQARLAALEKVKEMQMKKFLAAGGEALEKGLAERQREDEAKAARELAAANARAEADATLRQLRAREKGLQLRATLGAQLAEREAERERQRRELMVVQRQQKAAEAQLKAEIKREKEAAEATKRSRYAEQVERIRVEKNRRYETFEDHMSGVEKAMQRIYLEALH